MAKNLPAKQETGRSPGSGRSPGEENGNPLYYSCLENSMDRGVWWAMESMESQSQTRLNDKTKTTECLLLVWSAIVPCHFIVRLTIKCKCNDALFTDEEMRAWRVDMT